MTISKRFLSLDDLTHLPPPVWMIEGMFEKGSLVMLAGPSYSFKSFLALDWALCMASQRKWLGRPTVPAKVLYMLGEGKSGLLKRVKAWMEHQKLTEDSYQILNQNFRVSFEMAQLGSPISVTNLLAQLEEENFKPEVIVIDTLARSTVGINENEQEDMGIWIDQADRLRQLGNTVIFIHHTKKNQEFGVTYRGASAIVAGVDTAMTLVRNGGEESDLATLRFDKQKEHEEGQDMKFMRQRIPIPGDSEPSMVLVPAQQIDERFTEEYKVTENMIMKLIGDGSYESDRARARDLAAKTGLSIDAALSRIRRRRSGDAE